MHELQDEALLNIGSTWMDLGNFERAAGVYEVVSRIVLVGGAVDVRRGHDYDYYHSPCRFLHVGA